MSMVSPAPAIMAKRVTVRSGRLLCDVEVSPQWHYSTPALARAVLQTYPELSRHACVNGVSDTFGAVIAETSLPHLLEHVAISLQVRATGRPDATYVGVTAWTDEARGRARIQLSFDDDLVALSAFKQAADFLNTTIAELD